MSIADDDDLLERFTSVQKSLASATDELDELISSVEAKRDQVLLDITQKLESAQFSQFNLEDLEAFLEEPYLVLPKKKDEWWVVAPRFVDFQIGWLERSTPSYNVFIVNKFMHWLAKVPQKLQARFKFKPRLPLRVFDGMLLTGEVHQSEAYERYKKHLLRREGKDRIRIRRGHEFDLIAGMIDDGILPFIPTPVEEEDLRDPCSLLKAVDWRDGKPPHRLELRDYQERAWRKFLETGAVGVFYPFGSGKTMIGEWACASLEGRKVVIVDTVTLKEQWAKRFETHTWISDEVDVETYHSFHRVMNREYVLVIYDECHRLPATTFSRMSTVKSKYRIGLSATPYREDGRAEYIFALTGFPIGLDWSDLLNLGIVTKPIITLYVLPDLKMKLVRLAELLEEPMKTLIYCDSIQLGKDIGRKHGIPFVFGDTSKRLEVVEASETTVISRVGDAGLSVKDLERVIEVDFLYGSRMQEGQRMGRLFHGVEGAQHIILMTEDELASYEKRLYAIYEHGFRINVVR